MDPSAQHQELFRYYKTIEESMAMSPNSSSKSQQLASLNQLETHQDHHLLKKPRPQLPDQSLKCPRCDSTNTKFCYYNNYSLSQPRYFCKSCRRYWTKGGTLRNIPFGGGCRKNRRSSSSSSPGIRAPDHSDDVKMIPATATTTSFCGYNSDYQIDLGLAFALFHKQPPGQLFHDEQLISVLGNSTAYGILGNSTSGAFGVMSGPKVGTENAGYAIGNAGGLDHQMGSEPNKVSWGFPCQTNGESFGIVNSFVGLDQNDSGRESGNTNGMMMSSSWNGLLKTSPLI